MMVIICRGLALLPDEISQVANYLEFFQISTGFFVFACFVKNLFSREAAVLIRAKLVQLLTASVPELSNFSTICK